MTAKSITLGALFGFVLSRVGATDYDAIRGMFRLSDLHLMGVIGTAVVLSSIGFFVIRRHSVRAIDGTSIALEKKPMTPFLVPGALLFGIGWALSGTCPGTALAQVGEGRWAAFATLAGILLGAYLGEGLVNRRTAKARLPVERPLEHDGPAHGRLDEVDGSPAISNCGPAAR